MNEKQPIAKILIVDDVEVNLIAIEDTLSDMPAEIFRADSGEAALKLITQHEFAVVLLDVQMPGMDGFETAEYMRKYKYTETVPIIFVTAINKEKVHLFKGYQSGAVDYLFKPLDPQVLRAKIKIFLDIYYQKTQRLVSALAELEQTKVELERRNEELELVASKDALTNLPNRSEFEAELSRTLSFCARYKESFAVLFIDLDNFKTVNDAYGHMVGDSLLKVLAVRFVSQLRREDFLARLGGDEFGVILTKINRFEDAGRVARNLQNIFKGNLMVMDNDISVTCSIGIACYPFAGKTTDDLVKHADIAMYRAKEQGKNGFEYFSESLSKEYCRRMAIEKSLTHAIEKNEFYLAYQTIYDLKSGKPYGVETLIRWQNDELGFVSPDEFIPIAEDVGQIHEIGLWVISNACQQFERWHNAGMHPINYSINLSPKQLFKSNLFAFMNESIAKYKIPPECVELELTETAIMGRDEMSEDIVHAFDQIGIRVNIDDFGTGYSSLVRLRYLPINALKVDKSFVRDILVDRNDAIIVKAILSLARSLGLKTIAEGIESQQQLNFLLEHGCDFGQGYFLAKPLGSDEILNIFLEAQKNE